MDDRLAVDVIEVGQDTLFEFGFGCNPHDAASSGSSLEKKPSTKLSHESCFGVNTSVKRPSGRVANQALVSFEICAE